MRRNNRNLFSFLAILAVAGAITGIGSAFLLLSGQLGSDSKVVLNADSKTTPAALSPFKIMGTHTATVLNVIAASDINTDADISADANTNPAMSLIASGSYDSIAQLWDRASGKTISLRHTDRVNDLAFTPDGEHLVTGSNAGDIALWSVPTGTLETTVQAEAGRILSLAVDAGSQTVAVSTSEGALQVWSIADAGGLRFLWTIVEEGQSINAIAFHPTNDAVLVSGDQNGLIRVWDIERRQVIWTLDDSADRIISLGISPDGRYIASGSYDQAIRIWDLASGERLHVLTGHNLAVSGVAFSPDSALLASSSYDESIKVWNWAKEKELCTLKGHAGFVYSVAFADGGSKLVSGGYDGTVRTWDLTESISRSCRPR